MANEIERKFIVRPTQIPWENVIEWHDISQGYFPLIKNLRIRESIITYEELYSDEDRTYELTFKKNKNKQTNLDRKEYNFKIPKFVFFPLWYLTPWMTKTKKTRHIIPTGEQINEYPGQYYVIVEMEFDSLEDAQAYIPDFKYVTEITHVPWAKEPYLSITPWKEIEENLKK